MGTRSKRAARARREGVAGRGARGLRVLLLLPLLLARSLSGCGAEDPAPAEPTAQGPASVLLITMDTTRADHLGCYGRELARTPNLDRLAERSVCFEEALSVCPLTLPSHATILTGLLPFRHHVRDNGTRTLQEESTTLAERLAAEGYQTAAFVAAVVLNRRSGLAQGFEEWQEPVAVRRGDRQYTSITAAEVNAKVLPWLAARDPSRPLFLWVHYFDPHAPYEPPERFRPEGEASDYDGEIQAMDHAIGEVLAAFDEAVEGPSMTVAVADHGEGLGFRGEPTHAHFVYQPHVRVPMMIRHVDGHAAGTRRHDPVSVADVLPTVLSGLGLPAEPAVDGLDLRAPPPPDRAVYFESYYPYFAHRFSPLVGIRTADAKYIHSSEPELYRLGPGELESEDVAAREPERVEEAADRLRALLYSAAGEVEGGGRMGADELARLRALGYVAMPESTGPVPDPFALPEGLVSPAGKGEFIRRFRQAALWHPDWNAVDAVAELQELWEESPEDTAVLDHLGRFLLESRRYSEAIPPLERLIELLPHHYGAWLSLGTAHQALGDHPRAVPCFRKASEIDPRAPMPLRRAIDSLTRMGQTAAAASLRQRLEQLQRGAD